MGKNYTQTEIAKKVLFRLEHMEADEKQNLLSAFEIPPDAILIKNQNDFVQRKPSDPTPAQQYYQYS